MTIRCSSQGAAPSPPVPPAPGGPSRDSTRRAGAPAAATTKDWRGWRAWLPAVPLAILVAWAFLPSLWNGFVNWDDDRNFLDNPHFRGLGPRQLAWAATTFHLGVYQPLAWLLFEAQYAAFGLDPRGYHAASLLLHAADALILYALILALLGRCRLGAGAGARTRPAAAALAVALFAVHPLRVEAVAWASCQPYLPCAGLAMLAVLAYLRGGREGPPGPWAVRASFTLFVAALLCHPTAVSLPVVLLILDAYPLRRLGGGPAARRALAEKIPFVLASLLFAALAVGARGRALAATEQRDAPARLAQACHAAWFYLIKTAVPIDLRAVYPSPSRIDWRSPPFLAAILATAATTAGLILLRRRLPGLLAAWLSYLVILAPNSGLVRISDEFAADRYSYLPMLPLVAVVAAGLARPGAVALRWLAIAAAVALAALSWAQCRTWRDSETLWGHAIAHGSASSAVAHYNLGLALAARGKLASAAARFDEAVRLDPNDADARKNLGVVLQRLGKLPEAEARYREAIRLDPDDPDAHYNLGVVLSRRGRYAEAALQYRETLRLDPGSARAHNNLGADLFQRGDYGAAATQFAEALRLDPARVDARRNLGMALSRLGRAGPEPRDRADRRDPGPVDRGPDRRPGRRAPATVPPPSGDAVPAGPRRRAGPGRWPGDTSRAPG